jgi:uncharacterized protein YcbX
MTTSGRQVASLTYTPVKGTSLVQPESVELEAGGIPEDRLFHLLDATTYRQIGASPKLLPITSRYRPSTGCLAMELPDGERADATVVLGDEVTARIGWDRDRPMDSRLVTGPWSALLSTYLGQEVLLARVLRPEGAVDVAPITLVSRASVRRAERQLNGQHLAIERFRMNLNLDGLGEHEEDEWYGRRITLGGAVLLVTGPVPRCAVTTYNPVTGERDASTLKAIVQYRKPIPMPGGNLVKAPFGVYARVQQPGRVRVGDAVELIE